jgi:hypothetical protein
MRKILILAAAAILFGASGAARGDTYFFENFNSEHGGTGLLNYSGFGQWSVTKGSVDLIGNGFWDLLPGHGLYLDMDGTTNAAGGISSVLLYLPAGDFDLTYALAGSQRGVGGNVSARILDNVNAVLASQNTSLGSGAVFSTYDLSFSLPTEQMIRLNFESNDGPSNQGLLLDTIQLTGPAPASVGGPALIVPLPSALWSGLALLGGLAGARWKRSSKA